jgi:hypothetical protein
LSSGGGTIIRVRPNSGSGSGVYRIAFNTSGTAPPIGEGGNTMTAVKKRMAALFAAALLLAGCEFTVTDGLGNSRDNAIYLWEGSFKNAELAKDKSQWFSFTAPEEGAYYIHVIFGTLENLNVRVYNRNGSPAGGEANLRKRDPDWYISREIPASGTYYIEVWPRFSGDSGTFRIAYNRSAIPPQ